MNLFKFSVLSTLVVFSFLSLSGSAFGADSAVNTTSSTDNVSKSVLVSTVNIENAKIVSQDGNNFVIAFSFTNREGLQAGIKYGVYLVPDGADYMADEKVYDESVTLNENSSVNKEITYSAPAQLGGSFTLLLSSKNSSGFPFGTAILGKVKLTATKKGVEINNNSCYLNVVNGDKEGAQNKISQVLGVSGKETLRLTCTATNNADTDLSMTPYFETRADSSFGDMVQTTGGDTSPVSFKKGEKKTFSISLPKGDMPGMYNIKVGLTNGDVLSNKISINYSVKGISATLNKISLDKDSYQRGDQGSMSILWTVFGNMNFEGKADILNMPPVNLKASILNGKGRECAKDIEQALVRDFNNPETKISFEVTSTCIDPKVVASLTDSAGNVFDQKEFAFISSGQEARSQKQNQNIRNIFIILAVVLMTAIIIAVEKKKKKQKEMQKITENKTPDNNIKINSI